MNELVILVIALGAGVAAFYIGIGLAILVNGIAKKRGK